MNIELSDTNFEHVAASNYECVFLDEEEFQEDLKRFLYIKRLLKIYSKTGEFKERLIINHVIILFNVFGEMTPKLLFFKIDEYDRELKTLLAFLQRMPNVVTGIGRTPILSEDIPLDDNIWRKLNNL